MTLTPHVIGGYCLTGFTASVLFDININSSQSYLAAVFIGSFMPDICNPKALAGRMVYPVAKVLYSRFGHRTITHSLLWLVCMYLVISGIEKVQHGTVSFAQVLTLAWFFHILLDTLTKNGGGFTLSFFRYFDLVFCKQRIAFSNG